MPRSPRVAITLADGTMRVYEDVPYTVSNNHHASPKDPRPESHYLLVTLPAEREVSTLDTRLDEGGA